MATVAGYVQGTPCWAELLSADEAAARTFYGGLFGWEYEANEMAPGMTYYTVSLDGAVIAGVMQQDATMADAGLPTGWNAYIAVDSADAAAVAVTRAGGTLKFPVDEIPGVGRFVLAADNQGTAIGFWEGKGLVGSAVVDQPGAVSWYELQVDDVEAVKPFYKAVASLEANTGPAGDLGEYTEFFAAGKSVAGALVKPMPEMPNSWVLYFNVTDADAAVASAVKLGGSVLAPAFDVPSIGRLAVMADPQGAVFCLMSH
ncbi:VOC family protein [Arthrobacter sp. 35W]|uniref:VOC family protein n=1 Tax=Arthrobacter sp. 35W TaxID=1132441 RepID=UPI00041F75BE|nr:VOC family protein [Arthrobacter sp. 35W]